MVQNNLRTLASGRSGFIPCNLGRHQPPFFLGLFQVYCRVTAFLLWEDVEGYSLPFFLERQFWPVIGFWLTKNTDVAILEEFGLFLQLLKDLSSTIDTVKFLATGFAHFEEFFFLIDTEETAPQKVCGDTGGAASGERVKYPGPWFSGSLNNSR